MTATAAATALAGPVAAASSALRHTEVGPDAAIVWEGPDGPRFPNGAVADAGQGPPRSGRLLARRWWDPTCPIGGLDRSSVDRFVRSIDPLPLPPRLPSSPDGWIGWGPGLTPAGDDVVVGLLIGLRAGGRTDLADDLAQACADADTTPLSRALLDHAAGGRAAGPVLGLIRALSGQRPLAPAVATLQRFGATSGRHVIDGVRRAMAQTGVLAQTGATA